MFSENFIDLSSKIIVAETTRRKKDLTRDFNPVSAEEESDHTEPGDIFLDDNISALMNNQIEPQDSKVTSGT